MKILVTDDSKMARKSLIRKIPENIKESAEIFEAENGKEALFQFKTLKPDIVFMDLTMPIMDGYEAIAEIKKIDADAKIIVVSADVQSGAVERVQELGALRHISKEIEAEEFKKLIEELV